MIPDVSQALAWLEKHPQALKGIQRGLERETLRVNADGTLATTGHPEALGSALTHKWITTDFAEALLEFITPVDGDIEHMLTFMRDLHRYTARNMGDERMWPLSMPCYIAEGQDIELAQYGTSNTGRFKTLYREGLKNRYGALMPKRKFLRAISALSAITIVSVGSFLICLVHLRRFVLLSCKENQRRCRLRKPSAVCITCRMRPLFV